MVMEVPCKARNFFTSLAAISVSRRSMLRGISYALQLPDVNVAVVYTE
jgi:hypothetical protein